MKKSLSLLFALMLAMTVNAQVFFDQTFSGSSLPSGWSFDGEGKNSMLIQASAYCGGAEGEALIASANQGLPDFNGYARLVSPACDFTGVDEFLVSFKYLIEFSASAQNMIKVGIAASDDNGSTWEDLWSQNNTYNVTKEVRQTVSLPADMEKSSVKLCVYIYCNGSDLHIAGFDDVRALVQKEYNVSLTSINVANYISRGETEVSFSLSNIGSKTITSFVAKYQFDGYEEVSQNFSTYMAPFSDKKLTFNVPTNITRYENLKLTVSVIAVNNVDDQDNSDNTLEKNVSVAWASDTQRIPMIEHFSGSDCYYCPSVNTSMKTLTANNPGKYTYTKYAIAVSNNPSTADSHMTNEGIRRFNYYECDGVPSIRIDGIDKGRPISQAVLDNRYETPAIADVRGIFNVEGNTLNVTADFMAYADMNDVRAFVVVNEKVIEKNGAMGETEFHHIMLKMLGGDEGTSLNLKAGEYQRLTFSQNMASTKMQDINDLEVSLWLQDITTGEIFNSHFAEEYTDELCNPIQNLSLNVEGDNLNITFEAPEEGTPTGYNVYNNGVLVAENTTEMSHSVAAEYYNVISVVALYSDGRSSVPVAKLSGTGLGVDEAPLAENIFNIYPNPAKDYVKVSGENINTISVYNTLGALVEKINVENNTTVIYLSEYNTGVYFINVEQNNGVSTTQKMVVTK